MEPLGAHEIDLHGLVTIDRVVIEEENLVGARLPVAREVKLQDGPLCHAGQAVLGRFSGGVSAADVYLASASPGAA